LGFSGSLDGAVAFSKEYSEFSTLSGVVRSLPSPPAACVFDLAPFRGGPFDFSFGAALFAFFTGFSSVLVVRDACRVFSLLLVSTEAGVALVVRFVTFASGSDVCFAVALDRTLFAVFGTSWGRSSSRSSDLETLVRLLVTVFFVVAFGFSSICVSGSTFFVLFRRAGALMPPPAAASSGFSVFVDCVRARVDTMFNRLTRFRVVGIGYEMMQFGGGDVYEKNLEALSGIFVAWGNRSQPDRENHVSPLFEDNGVGVSNVVFCRCTI